MEYLLIDAHQRFLGMMRSDRALAVGDIFQGENAQTYTVVGVDSSNRRISSIAPGSSIRRQSLTVVAVNRPIYQEQVQMA